MTRNAQPQLRGWGPGEWESEREGGKVKRKGREGKRREEE